MTDFKAALLANIDAFVAMKSLRKPKLDGHYAVIHEAKLAGVFTTRTQAQTFALGHYSDQPFLVRQISANITSRAP